MKIIETTKAPKAIGPYSQAIQAGSFLFVSGQLGILPDTGNFAGDTPEAQADQALKNIEAILDTAGTGLHNVADVTLYLKNMDDFNAVNAAYAGYFKDHKPARATVEVSKLPKNAKVEIRVTALIKS